MKGNQLLFGLLFFLALVIFSFLLTHRLLDPDFGWHLKTGQLILERGVPHSDWYSFTMPDFLWIDHEWLTDVIVHVIYSSVGFYALLLIFLAIYLLSFFVAVPREEQKLPFYLLVVLSCFIALEVLGIRPQVITVLFIAITWRVVSMFLKTSSRMMYLLPLLFLLWVNLHAGFLAGLFLVSILLGVEVFKKSIKGKSMPFLRRLHLEEQDSKKILAFSLVVASCFLATLFNPYGIRVYEEIYRTMGDPDLKSRVAEWAPLFSSGVKPLLYGYVGIFAGAVMVMYRRAEINKIIVPSIFLLLSILSVRHVLLFMILSLPLLVEAAGLAKDGVRNAFRHQSMGRLDKALGVMVLATLVLFFCYGAYKSVDRINRNDARRVYPEKAVSFLQSLPVEGNLLHEYQWGGYLIWKLPERKVFIDGRMPSWRDSNGSALDDYFTIMQSEEGFEALLQKYNIRQALISNKPSPPKNPRFEDFSRRYPWFVSFFLGHRRDLNPYEELTALGWKTVYRDSVAIILKK